MRKYLNKFKEHPKTKNGIDTIIDIKTGISIRGILKDNKRENKMDEQNRKRVI